MLDENYLPIHSFELFPRENLMPEISRRLFFAGLKVELDLYTQQRGGTKIGELGLLENNELYELIPMILPGTAISIRNQEIWAVPPGKNEAVRLFVSEKNTLIVYNQINGKKPLRKIAEYFSCLSDLPFERSFLYTRGLFLTLVKEGVCLPVNNPLFG